MSPSSPLQEVHVLIWYYQLPCYSRDWHRKVTLELTWTISDLLQDVCVKHVLTIHCLYMAGVQHLKVFYPLPCCGTAGVIIDESSGDPVRDQMGRKEIWNKKYHRNIQIAIQNLGKDLVLKQIILSYCFIFHLFSELN